MAVRLRLRRTGKKKQAHYRLVAADSRSKRDGRFLETLGHYNPRLDPPVAVVKEDRIYYWIDKGAEMTEAFRGIMKNQGLLLKFKLMKKGASETEINEEMQKWAMSHELRVQKRRARISKKKKQKAKMEADAVDTAEETPVVDEGAEVAAEAAPAEEAPVEETPVEEKAEEKAEEKPVEEAPVEETPEKETAEEKPAEEAPAEEKSEEKAAEEKAEEASADETPVEEAKDKEEKPKPKKAAAKKKPAAKKKTEPESKKETEKKPKKATAKKTKKKDEGEK